MGEAKTAPPSLHWTILCYPPCAKVWHRQTPDSQCMKMHWNHHLPVSGVQSRLQDASEQFRDLLYGALLARIRPGLHLIQIMDSANGHLVVALVGSQGVKWAMQVEDRGQSRLLVWRDSSMQLWSRLRWSQAARTPPHYHWGHFPLPSFNSQLHSQACAAQ